MYVYPYVRARVQQLCADLNLKQKQLDTLGEHSKEQQATLSSAKSDLLSIFQVRFHANKACENA
jgi:multidrug resistance efflux pump